LRRHARHEEAWCRFSSGRFSDASQTLEPLASKHLPASEATTVLKTHPLTGHQVHHVPLLAERTLIDLSLGVAHAGERVVRFTARELQVLATIALSGGTASTDTVVDAVWPDADPFSARRCFKVYVHRIRTRLGNPKVLGTHFGRWSVGPTVTCDVWEWERLADGSRTVPLMDPLRVAFTHACDRLMAGPAPALDACGITGTVQMRFGELRDRIASTLIDDAYAAGDADRMRTLANALIALDPYAERWHEARIRALLLAGEETAARAALQSFNDTLQTDLGTLAPQRVRRLITGLDLPSSATKEVPRAAK
jgi:hypothetical protein